MRVLREDGAAHFLANVAIGVGIIFVAAAIMHWIRSAGLSIAGRDLLGQPADIYRVLSRWQFRAFVGAMLLQFATMLAAWWVQGRTRVPQAQGVLAVAVLSAWLVVVGLTFAQLETMPELQQTFRAYWNDPSIGGSAPPYWPHAETFTWPMLLDQRIGMSTLVTPFLLFGPPLLLGYLAGEGWSRRRRPGVSGFETEWVVVGTSVQHEARSSSDADTT